ncbi:5723_t:CDS:2 [Diversispora eburnea]|uniref:5723_t:CDS:1 n=1 Tax=Diversispora eburnea TaxID=1213867 RepID=A0A9N9FHY4_9GLOM|nr:5723_t:CDS:2 [Diversispora eburnea]
MVSIYLNFAPEEDFISVHIRIVGDFTEALDKKLRCYFDKENKENKVEILIGAVHHSQAF